MHFWHLYTLYSRWMKFTHRCICTGFRTFPQTKWNNNVCLHTHILLFIYFLIGGMHTCGGSASSLLHGSIQLDAGRGAAALEQGCRGKPEWGTTHEVLLSHRLGYNGFTQSPFFLPIFRFTCSYFYPDQLAREVQSKQISKPRRQTFNYSVLVRAVSVSWGTSARFILLF